MNHQASLEKCDILLITVTDIETKALWNALKEALGRESESVYGANKTYHNYGEVSGAKIFTVRSEMGSDAPGAALSTVYEALTEVDPSHVIMVGIAFGVDPEKQPIGQILMSQQLQGYDLKKIDKHGKIIPRGDKVTASVKLLNLFKDANLKLDFGAKSCLILSGQSLVDHIDYRKQLEARFPGACGGEMEGQGLYSAARKKEWLLIKAVCDYADGNKGENKKQNQEKAAMNAAQFVVKTLTLGGFSHQSKNRSDSVIEPIKTTEEKKTYNFSRQKIIPFCDRLLDDWIHLANFLGIPASTQRSFRRGYECIDLWDWLDARGKIDDLPAALKAIQRADLISIFESDH
ncbi:phosphorylase family protein [Magnetococcales bacterium HHB-1]